MIRWVVLLGLAGCSSAASAPEVAAPSAEPLVVFLVRHAEKVDESQDSPLSNTGKARATDLARTLEDAELTGIHSTRFERTLDTAGPLARMLGIEVQTYAANDLDALLDRLRGLGGRHLVVGHSNTTPLAVRKLGGKPGPAIRQNEYDRLYMVTVSPREGSSTVLLRYGH
ncbi:MAG: histidine phosphatase family protein [Myxococcota bacterium]